MATSTDPNRLQVNTASTHIESSSEEDTARRSFVPNRGTAQHPAKYQVGDKAVYVAIVYKTPPMNVEITARAQDPMGKWTYQVEDDQGDAVQATGKSEPLWIPQGKLSLRK